MLYFENVKIWTAEEKSWIQQKVTKQSVCILRDVSGKIHRGEFVALLGPSGAGKTTFLTALGGRCRLPQSGRVELDGQPVESSPPGTIELVPQMDTFLDTITVAEHVQFMTEMKLGSCRRPEIRLKMEQLLGELMLESQKNTIIRGLSGGERRLLSMAVSLISNPRVVLCDEPTTGLDSYNALLVVETLSRLSRKGITIVCSIHQPSSGLFSRFSSLILMAEGRLVFHGNHEDCKSVFERVNLRCPTNYNPAEYYIREISSNAAVPVDQIEKLHTEFRKFYETKTEIKSDYNLVGVEHHVVIRRNWFVQVYLLVWRYSLTVRQNLIAWIGNLIITMVISAVIVSVCFTGMSSTSQRGVQNASGFLWLLVSEVAYGLSYHALFAFEADLAVFKREIGIYSCSAFYVATFVCFIPYCIISSCAYAAIATASVTLPDHSITVLEIISALIVCALASTAYGLGMGALFLSTGLINDAMPSVDLPLTLVSGVFLSLSSLPAWLTVVKYLSHFYYGMDVVSNIYWRKIPHIDCDTSMSGSCVTSGADLLEALGYSTNFLITNGLGLLGVTAFWSLLGYLGLKREERRGYAY